MKKGAPSCCLPLQILSSAIARIVAVQSVLRAAGKTVAADSRSCHLQRLHAVVKISLAQIVIVKDPQEGDVLTWIADEESRGLPRFLDASQPDIGHGKRLQTLIVKGLGSQRVERLSKVASWLSSSFSLALVAINNLLVFPWALGLMVRREGMGPSWLVWVPLVNLSFVPRFADASVLSWLLLFVPIANIYVWWDWWSETASTTTTAIQTGGRWGCSCRT